MRKLLLTATLIGAGLTAALSAPAEARVYVGVGIGVPGVAVVAPIPGISVVPAPYYYVRPGYYYPGYIRYGYGLPYGGRRVGYGWGYRYGRRWR